MGQNLSRKTVEVKRIFLSDLNMSKNYEKMQAHIGWKIAVTVKIWAHSELRIRNEKLYRAQIRAEIKSPIATFSYQNR